MNYSSRGTSIKLSEMDNRKSVTQEALEKGSSDLLSVGNEANGGAEGKTPWIEFWCKKLEDAENVPQGLQYLTSVDTVIIAKLPGDFLQNINPNIILPYDVLSAYCVMNKEGKQIYYAFEEDICSWISENIGKMKPRQRKMIVHLTDREGHDVATFERKLRPFTICCNVCSCLPPCKEKVTVFLADLNNVKPIGYVVSKYSPYKTKYNIKEPNKMPRFRLKGSKKGFNIIAGGIKNVGKISTKWTGLDQDERFCKYGLGQFGCIFNPEESHKVKVMFIASAFLINIKFFVDKESIKKV